MLFSRRGTVLGLFVVQLRQSFAQNSLTTCPMNETVIADDAGNTFAVCPKTDYNWASNSVTGGVKSDAECATICVNSQGCTQAVYDRIYGYCHIKAQVDNGLWRQNDQFDAIRRYTGIISSCPVAENMVKDDKGQTWALCPFTDYQGDSVSYTRNNINSNTDCVKLCAATTGCIKGVYDRVEKGCHVKATNGLTWTTSTRYDSMRLVSGSTTSDSNAGGFACTTKQTILTTTDGSTFALCARTDWQGASIYVLNNFASAQVCTEACSLTPVCTNAIWDRQNNVCHIKAAVEGLTQAQNDQFDQIRLIKKGAAALQPSALGGKWSDLIPFPIVPAAAYVVPQQPQASKIMAFSANADQSFGSRTGLTQFATFDYVQGSISKRIVSNTNHDMFCPGISTLQDGRVVVTGGSDAAVVSVYNPSTNDWTRAPDMNLGRGYQSSTTLSNGKIFTIGGSFSGGIQTKNGEIFDPVANSWTMLPGCKADSLNTQDTPWRRDNHAWLYGWSDGTIFHAGPSRAMLWYSTKNGGSVTSAGTRNATDDAMCGLNVMYDTGKILAAGGTPLYDDSASVTTSYIITIPQIGQQAKVQKVADLNHPRAFANTVVLPDGTVMVLGGQKRSRQFTDIESITYPELFSPVTNTWKVLNAEAVPRNYHSTAILLGDGTVFSGGGGLCYVGAGAPDDSWGCDPSAQHMNAQIYSPPYLFNSDGSIATRPLITAISSSTDNTGYWVRPGGTLTINMSDNSATTFSIVRLGSATHSVNTDQRRLSLTAAQRAKTWTIRLPSDSGILLPGYWFVFAINQKGTPSIARVLQVKL